MKRKPYYSSGFPDLSTDKEGVAPVSNVIPGFIPKKAKKDIKMPEGFVAGNPHKQGSMICPAREVQYLGGKKS